MQAVNVTVFQCPSLAGREFARMAKQALGMRRLRGLPIEVRIQEHGTQFDMLQASYRDDVVIFDGSIEDEGGTNYAAATAQAMTMDHVLIVSRTRLPLNFVGSRKGGTPDTAGRTDGQVRLENEDLVQWILRQLNELEPDLPRPINERLNIPSFEVITRFVEPMRPRTITIPGGPNLS